MQRGGTSRLHPDGPPVLQYGAPEIREPYQLIHPEPQELRISGGGWRSQTIVVHSIATIISFLEDQTEPNGGVRLRVLETLAPQSYSTNTKREGRRSGRTAGSRLRGLQQAGPGPGPADVPAGRPGGGVGRLRSGVPVRPAGAAWQAGAGLPWEQAGEAVRGGVREGVGMRFVLKYRYIEF